MSNVLAKLFGVKMRLLVRNTMKKVVTMIVIVVQAVAHYFVIMVTDVLLLLVVAKSVKFKAKNIKFLALNPIKLKIERRLI
ncbi:hypothetical protein ACT7CY_18410 [Bacillus pacificus]